MAGPASFDGGSAVPARETKAPRRSRSGRRPASDQEGQGFQLYRRWRWSRRARAGIGGRRCAP